MLPGTICVLPERKDRRRLVVCALGARKWGRGRYFRASEMTKRRRRNGRQEGRRRAGGRGRALPELAASLHQNILPFYRFSAKRVCVAPPRYQGRVCHLPKDSLATCGCTCLPKRTPRWGQFPLDICGVSRNGVFSEKTEFRNSVSSEKTPLRDTPQISRGNKPERSDRLRTRARPLVARNLFWIWRVPS